MSFHAIRENKILAKISEFTVVVLIALSSNEDSGGTGQIHRLARVTQTRKSLRCSHTQSIDEDADSDQNLEL